MSLAPVSLSGAFKIFNVLRLLEPVTLPGHSQTLIWRVRYTLALSDGSNSKFIGLQCYIITILSSCLNLSSAFVHTGRHSHTKTECFIFKVANLFLSLWHFIWVIRWPYVAVTHWQLMFFPARRSASSSTPLVLRFESLRGTKFSCLRPLHNLTISIIFCYVQYVVPQTQHWHYLLWRHFSKFKVSPFLVEKHIARWWLHATIFVNNIYS